MKIIRELQQRISIESFAEKHDLTMVIRERTPKNAKEHGRFMASFKSTEVKNGGLLISVFGNGDTEFKAIQDYANKISGQILVVHGLRKDRKDIKAPILEAE